MDPLQLKVNLTTAFMLPILLNKGLKHSDILTDTFINAYMADLSKPEKDNSLIIRYATITDLPEWVEGQFAYVDDDTAHIMVTENIPDNLTEDYHKFLIGDYSKFSEEYKKQVLEFWEADEDTFMYGVLYKSGDEIKKFWREDLETDLDMVPDTEYWRPPNLKQEIFGMQGDE
jgi:hypothetical protein